MLVRTSMLLFLGALLALASACADSPTRAIRQITYAPDLRYVEGKEINEVMRVLARDSVAINDLLRDEGLVGTSTRTRVVSLLKEIEDVTLELDTTQVTNHPVLSQNLALFREDILAARHAVENEPPNYFLAGAVAGSCFLYCHTGGRAQERR